MVDSPLWPELRAALKKCPILKAGMKTRKTHEEKKAFKKEWAGSRAVETKKELQMIESLAIDDVQEGEMMTLRKLSIELPTLRPRLSASQHGDAKA